LRRKPDFDAVHARGRRWTSEFFTVTARSNDLGWPRIGLAVASKTAGGSVGRNRIRRLIRESFRLRQHDLPSLDFVVSARTAAKATAARDLRTNLDTLWTRVKG
jgi:ribonuclease P protein component